MHRGIQQRYNEERQARAIQEATGTRHSTCKNFAGMSVAQKEHDRLCPFHGERRRVGARALHVREVLSLSLHSVCAPASRGCVPEDASAFRDLSPLHRHVLSIRNVKHQTWCKIVQGDWAASLPARESHHADRHISRIRVGRPNDRHSCATRNRKRRHTKWSQNKPCIETVGCQHCGFHRWSLRRCNASHTTLFQCT